MEPVFCSVVYGKKEIHYTIFRCRRKTLEISVLPDGTVEVRAPFDSAQDVIESRVKKRIPWIIRQQAYFRQFCPRTPVRQYLGGETHLYLGRKYRLKVVSSEKEAVKLTHGFIHIYCTGKPASEIAKKLLNSWYRTKSRTIFRDIYNTLITRLEVTDLIIPSLQIREMKTRWGSLSKSGTLTLNVNLIRAPKECIEYVIAHELCHIQFHNHSKDFYKLLQSRMPDWKERKQKLEEALI